MRKKKAANTAPPEPKKFPPPGPRYYKRVELTMGQRRLPLDLPDYPNLAREARDAR